jgi:glycosyltransferase involved in cell wall biosynthesis
MATAPAITFAVPYLRNPGYLLEAIESVRAQTIENWEVVVIDDCGPEPADALVQILGDDRIRYIRNETNLGLARNWNECIRQSAAPLVTLLHCDDRLRPTYGEAVLAAAADFPAVAAIFTDAAIIGPDGHPARSLPDFVKRFARRPRVDHTVAADRGLASVLGNNYIFCPSICYRTALVGMQPFDPRWAMVLDLDNIARLLLHDQRLRGIRQPLYEYRRHRSNQTSLLTADATRFSEEIALYREIAAAATSKGWSRSGRVARRRLMVRTHLVVQIVNDVVHAHFRAASAKRVILWSDLRGRPVE